ncbi:MAG: class I SAM-dependent methyltransferase [Chloroflexi bacterium]|nr:class I SAM-dependent methyltransferase [Chloroflexota bacterium]
MQPEVITHLIDLNRQFYQTFGAAFAATRRRIQPGIRQVLGRIPPAGRWLDLGCGSGSLAVEWARAGRSGAYVGLDFSRALLEEAQTAVQTGAPHHPGLEISFQLTDLTQPDWDASMGSQTFDGALSFAVFHHLPAMRLRLQALSALRRRLPAGALFYHSQWQFQNSPRLMERVQPWALVGLSDADVEPNDYLLDWRYALPGQPEQVGYRYVHLFTREELAALASQAGFEVVDEFNSDGREGNLALYQAWRALD